MCKLFVNMSGRCGRMRASAWQCVQCYDCHELPRIVHKQLMSSSRVVQDMFTSSSLTVQEQFTTNARQWCLRRCVGIYRASWTLLAIPEMASEETTYITETTCRYNKADEMARLATTKSGPKVVQVSALHVTHFAWTNQNPKSPLVLTRKNLVRASGLSFFV